MQIFASLVIHVRLLFQSQSDFLRYGFFSYSPNKQDYYILLPLLFSMMIHIDVQRLYIGLSAFVPPDMRPKKHPSSEEEPQGALQTQ